MSGPAVAAPPCYTAGGPVDARVPDVLGSRDDVSI